MYAIPSAVSPTIATPAIAPPMMGPSFVDLAACVDVDGGEKVVVLLGDEDCVLDGVVRGLLLVPPV
jgi:hypothetical protein